MRTRGLTSSLCQWSKLVVMLIGVCGCVNEGRSQERQGPMVGRQAPPFHIQGIFDEDYSLESFRGHILVMQFGSSW